jgi:parallel beta-helix repeat protein
MATRIVFALAVALAIWTTAVACSVTIGTGSSDEPSTPAPQASPAGVTPSTPAAPSMTNAATPDPDESPSPGASSGPTVTLRPDGSGDAADLAAAVASLPDGGTIVLEPGTYMLESPLRVEQSVSLVGAGRDQTEVETTVAEAGLVVTADAFGAEGITFRHSGSRAGGMIVVKDADVRVVDCGFVGSTRTRRWSYEALWIKGTSSGYVRDCTFTDCAAGLGVSGYSRTTVEECRFEDCDTAGVAVYGYATSAVLRNVVRDCNDSGIAVSDSARPVIDSNRCSGCENGIAAGKRSEARIEENRCSDNLENGIIAYGRSSTRILDNVCMRNRESGIAALDDAEVHIDGNTTERNEGVGIGCWGGVTGKLSDNDVKRNGSGKSGGICIGGRATLTITGNDCERNKWYGILFRDAGSGTARDNHCAHSAYGILDNSSRSPRLIGNDLDWNSRQDVGRW